LTISHVKKVASAASLMATYLRRWAIRRSNEYIRKKVVIRYPSLFNRNAYRTRLAKAIKTFLKSTVLQENSPFCLAPRPLSHDWKKITDAQTTVTIPVSKGSSPGPGWSQLPKLTRVEAMTIATPTPTHTKLVILS